jgi:hypothetical protein
VSDPTLGAEFQTLPVASFIVNWRNAGAELRADIGGGRASIPSRASMRFRVSNFEQL